MVSKKKRLEPAFRGYKKDSNAVLVESIGRVYP